MCKITFRFKSKMGEVPCHIFLILFWINLQFSLVHAYEENCDSYQTKSNTSTLCKQHDHRLVCFHGLEDKWRSGWLSLIILLINNLNKRDNKRIKDITFKDNCLEVKTYEHWCSVIGPCRFSILATFSKDFLLWESLKSKGEI